MARQGWCTDDDPDGDIGSVTSEQAMADLQTLIAHADLLRERIDGVTGE